MLHDCTAGNSNHNIILLRNKSWQLMNKTSTSVYKKKSDIIPPVTHLPPTTTDEIIKYFELTVEKCQAADLPQLCLNKS